MSGFKQMDRLVIGSTIIVFTFLILGCKKEKEYIPPSTSVVDKQFNFHVVAPGFWRSGQPNTESIIRMKSHGLQTIINLRGDEKTDIWEKKVSDSLKINYYNFPLDSRVEQNPQELQEILSIIKEPQNQPVLVHCLGGKDRTGMIAGIYQMQFSDLGFEEIRKEMLMYGHDESYPEIIETVRRWRDTVREYF